MALTRRQQRELNQELERQQEQAARRGIRSGIARVLTRLARRILRLEVSETAEAMDRGEDGVAFAEEASQGAWVRRWSASLETPLEEVAVEAGEAIAEIAGTEALPPNMRQALDEHVSRLSQTLSETSYNNVRSVIEEAQRSGLSVPQTAARLREREPDMSQQRATLISRNELLTTSRLASHMQAEASGVVAGRIWRDSRDERVRPEHRRLNGEYAALGERFSNGALIVGEGDVNCRCYAEWVLKED